MRDFNYTINVLVKAYMNDTLQKCNCYACAVGNIIADAKGYTYIKSKDRFGKLALVETNAEYNSQLVPDWYGVINYDDYEACGTVKNEIEATGYTVKEIIRIEMAFEHTTYRDDNDVNRLEGLMAVVDVLADIHGIDLEVRKETKKLFVK